ETGFFERKDAAGERSYWVYVPEGDHYDPNVSCTLLIWLHPAGKGKDRDLKEVADFWQDFCDRYHIILLCPRAENETGWAASEADFIREAARSLMDHYTIDKRRVIVHGMGIGGQMAFYLGFHVRDLLRGVATTGAALANQPKPVVPSQPLSFFIATG